MCTRSAHGLLYVAVLVWRGTLFTATAVFTPVGRAILQGDGTSDGGGVFGCVGPCPQNLVGKKGHFYCVSEEKVIQHPEGSWMTGDGVCLNAARKVPDGQGSDEYGLIESWNVGKVVDMGWREFFCWSA